MTEYQRGYNRGKYVATKSQRARVEKIWRIAEGIRTRADRGAGLCRDCRYFRRVRDTHWGDCAASSDGDVTWLAPNRVSWFRPSSQGPLNVGEDFGCIHWAAIERARAKP